MNDSDQMCGDEAPRAGPDVDVAWMRIALSEADRAALLGEVPVGCVLELGGRELARGHNLRESTQDPTAHAEMVAIREASRVLGSWRLEQVTAYVTLEPCAMCAGALVLARVRRVVWGCRDPKGGAVATMFGVGVTERLNHRFVSQEGVLADLASARLQAFFSALRAKGKK